MDGGARARTLGNYDYAGRHAEAQATTASLDQLTLDYLARLRLRGARRPRRSASRRAKRYEAAGCDLLLCLVNPYKIPHEKVMQTIELMGKHVIPEFK